MSFGVVTRFHGHTFMQREIQIDLLDVDVWSLMRDKSPPPLGITIDGPRGRSLNSEGAGAVPMFLIMTITLPVATNLVASYLFPFSISD
jgi:hypothetical protein